MTTNETPNTGTPPAEVEALIAKLERRFDYYEDLDCGGDAESNAYAAGYAGGLGDGLPLLRTLTARIAELEGALEYEQAVANPYDIECYDGEWWVTAKTNNGFGPFDTEAEAQAKADEVNAPFREKFQQQLAAAAKAERAKCVAEARAYVKQLEAQGNGMIDDDEREAGLIVIERSVGAEEVADHLEANGRDVETWRS